MSDDERAIRELIQSWLTATTAGDIDRVLALVSDDAVFLTPGKEGSVTKADFTRAGNRLACIDSPAKHDFTFTPSISLFAECADEADLDRAFAALSAGGAVMMPPGNYGFSQKFTWVSDRFGV